MKPMNKRSGFTLVELLVVISIIAILSSLVIAGLSVANERSNEVQARTFVSNSKGAIEQYFLDMGDYPAYGSRKKLRETDNDFPALWRALMHEGRKKYLGDIQDDKVVVEDDEEEMGYRQATKAERDDAKVDKYVLDPWMQPYIYRCNAGNKPRDWMRNADKYDLYSLGPDGEDQTIEGSDLDEEVENDDIH